MPLLGILAGATKFVGKVVKKVTITKTATGRTPIGNLLSKVGIAKNKATNNPSPMPTMQTFAATDIVDNITSSVTGVSKKDLKQARRDAEYNDLQNEQSKDKGLLYLIWGGIALGVLAFIAWCISLVTGKKGRR